jgi:hypothetical protein
MPANTWCVLKTGRHCHKLCKIRTSTLGTHIHCLNRLFLEPSSVLSLARDLWFSG